MRNNSITIARVLSMLMIVGCHVANWMGIAPIAQLLNVGVEIFLVISGFLYSNKSIKKPLEFISGRWKKVMIPLYLIALFVAVEHIFIDGCFESLKNFGIYVVGMQGLPVMVIGMHVPGYIELAQTWFLTPLLICYALLLIYKRFVEWRCNHNSILVYAGVAIFLCCLDICLLLLWGLQIGYIFIFFLGYFVGKRMDEWNKKSNCNKSETILTIVMVFAVIVRLLCREYADDSVLYEQFVAIFSHAVIAVWFVQTIQYIEQKRPRLIETVASYRIIIWLDKNSFYIYLTHYMFFFGILSIDNLNLSIIAKCLWLVVGTIVMTVILGKSVEIIDRLFFAKRS